MVALLAGCATTYPNRPTAEQVAAADHGSYPSNYEDVVKAYYAGALKDPDSAKYRNISSPRKYWLSSERTGVTYGYLVCVTLNAKNSYGAYIGYQTDGMLIRNNSVLHYIPKANWFGTHLAECDS